MAKGRKTKLERLFEWKKRTFVDKMLDDGVSPNKVAKWINEQGMDISMPMVYTYAKRRKEAIIKGIQIEELLSHQHKNTKKNTNNSGSKGGNEDNEDSESYADKVAKENTESGPRGGKKRERSSVRGKKKSNYEGYNLTDKERKQENMKVNKVKTDMEILDSIVDKGFKTLQMMEVISPDMAIKAISLKHKITGGAHNGLTTYGIEEIRLREAARENSILAVLLEFIPEDKHEEAIQRMDEVTREYYESLGLGDQYDKLSDNGDTPSEQVKSQKA